MSVVTPTLNRAGLLESTLRSVRGQTYRNVEHIVMDGGSTDGTEDLLRRYEPTYRLRWRASVDAGMYHAINAGLAQAEGQILAYINSDDLYFPWTVAAVVDAFARRPDADFVFGDAMTIDMTSNRQALYWVPPFDLDAIRRSGFLAQPAVFWRRRVLDEDGGFDTSLQFVADCDYWMRAGAHRTFVKVPEFLAIERNHGQTLRQATEGAVWTELAQVRSRYVTLVGAKHERALQRHARRARRWWRMYSLGLLIQSVIPSAFRRGPWSRFLGDPGSNVFRGRMLLRALPLFTRIGVIRGIASGDLVRTDAPSRWAG